MPWSRHLLLEPWTPWPDLRSQLINTLLMFRKFCGVSMSLEFTTLKFNRYFKSLMLRVLAKTFSDCSLDTWHTSSPKLYMSLDFFLFFICHPQHPLSFSAYSSNQLSSNQIRPRAIGPYQNGIIQKASPIHKWNGRALRRVLTHRMISNG